MRKFVFVTGGVLSGLGKGVITASIGLLLKQAGFRVSLQKIDPYVNVDAGTMNPYEHGEVFVTNDGKETDLDIGRYERFLDENLSARNYATTGQVYWSVIRQERAGSFLGRTVQVIPHITDEIKKLIRRPVEDCHAEIAVVEIGGTVGDIESLPFLEALRQLKDELPRDDTFFVHLTLLPQMSSTDELKTKPTQHSVKELRGIGIQPDAIVARAERPVPADVRRKIALFCDVPEANVIEDIDQFSIYDVPLVVLSEGLHAAISTGLNLPPRTPDMTRWNEQVEKLHSPGKRVKIAIVGKYIELRDSYISIHEALVHAGVQCEAGIDPIWVSAESVDQDGPETYLSDVDGVLIPGGFGDRGVDGKVEAVSYARTNGIPFFGICLGLQCAAIEFARHCLGMEQANSSEFAPKTPYPVIDLMEAQSRLHDKGGTMRLGAYPADLAPGSISLSCYDTPKISERHRHRYEFNTEYREAFANAGFRVTGASPDGKFVEILELEDHPWFVGVQFHPEFKSHFVSPHPLFVGFVSACLARHSG